MDSVELNIICTFVKGLPYLTGKEGERERAVLIISLFMKFAYVKTVSSKGAVTNNNNNNLLKFLHQKVVGKYSGQLTHLFILIFG